jgi:hypothetical protein
MNFDIEVALNVPHHDTKNQNDSLTMGKVLLTRAETGMFLALALTLLSTIIVNSAIVNFMISFNCFSFASFELPNYPSNLKCSELF